MVKLRHPLGREVAPVLSPSYENLLFYRERENERVWHTRSENLSWVFDNSDVTIIARSASERSRPH